MCRIRASKKVRGEGGCASRKSRELIATMGASLLCILVTKHHKKRVCELSLRGGTARLKLLYVEVSGWMHDFVVYVLQQVSCVLAKRTRFSIPATTSDATTL